jgi:hypothetical protein
MCLIIQTVPASMRDANCVPCYKLWEESWGGNPVTPYQRAIIPNDGVLLVRKVTTQKRLNDEIGGRAIHAKQRRAKKSYWVNISKAYAFGVVAYGSKSHNDLVCSLLYIPHLDKSGRKTERIKQIGIWKRAHKGPTNSEVKRLFPNFVAPKP